MKFDGKVAVVSGGGSGIGLAIAQRFVEEGATVYVTARRQDVLDNAVRRLGNRAFAVQGDATKIQDVIRLFNLVQENHGHLDMLVLNAGRADYAELIDITEDHYDEVFNLNVKSVLFSVKAALPLLRHGSTITLIGSVADTIGTVGYSTYNASKAALRSFARTWTNEFAANGIRVNVVSPGPTQTAMTEAASKEVVEKLRGMIPLGRMGRAEEVAAAVRFLASDESSFIAGAELCVDGGMTQI